MFSDIVHEDFRLKTRPGGARSTMSATTGDSSKRKWSSLKIVFRRLALPMLRPSVDLAVTVILHVLRGELVFCSSFGTASDLFVSYSKRLEIFKILGKEPDGAVTTLHCGQGGLYSCPSFRFASRARALRQQYLKHARAKEETHHRTTGDIDIIVDEGLGAVDPGQELLEGEL